MYRPLNFAGWNLPGSITLSMTALSQEQALADSTRINYVNAEKPLQGCGSRTGETQLKVPVPVR